MATSISEFKSSLTPGADIKLLGMHMRYSTWTARIVVLLEHFQIPYDLELYDLNSEEGRYKIKQTTPAGFVPCLTVPSPTSPSSTIQVHESLGIAMYLADAFPSLPLWPANPTLRAYAFSISSEMHGSLGALRDAFPGNFCTVLLTPAPRSEAVERDARRALQIFDRARAATEREGVPGEYLFGGFGIADAFFWPLLWRLRTYGADVKAMGSEKAVEWIRVMWNETPALREVGRRQFEEPQRLQHYEAVIERLGGGRTWSWEEVYP